MFFNLISYNYLKTNYNLKLNYNLNISNLKKKNNIDTIILIFFLEYFFIKNINIFKFNFLKKMFIFFKLNYLNINYYLSYIYINSFYFLNIKTNIFKFKKYIYLKLLNKIFNLLFNHIYNFLIIKNLNTHNLLININLNKF